MPKPEATLGNPSRLLGALILAAATLLALGVPGGYFALRFIALGSALQIKTDVKAESVTRAIGQSPEMWKFEEHRMQELVQREPFEPQLEQVRVYAADGTQVVHSAQEPPGPWLSRTSTLFDSGRAVGTLQMDYALRPLLLQTTAYAVLGSTLGALLLVFMRRQQAHEQALAQQMLSERERARITLESISDAVVTTDLQLRVTYLNPVAELLTQWTLADARGQPLALVCNLVDEASMKPANLPVAQALAESRTQPFSGRELALVRRDGASLAIEDSAAPLLDAQRRVIGGVMVFRDVTATRRMAQRISWAAAHDSLTGLVNRREFESRVDDALKHARNFDVQHVLCYLDLDQFKVVNDTCGHAAGDALLKQLAGVLQQHLRDADTLGRLGGDEFGILLQGCALDRAELIAADLLAAVRDHRFQWDGKAFTTGVSMGLVAVNAETGSRAELFSAADTACYSAKEQGRNRVCVFKRSDADMAQRQAELGWAARLTNAMDDNRLVLYYQPYLPLSAHGGQGLHIEILLRLIDEKGQLVPPGSFLPAAERYNIMPRIDRWVISTVFSRHQELSALMGAPLTCAINLSGTTLNSEGLQQFIREQAALHHLQPGAVCFEITETAAINNMRHATQFMRELKTAGFSFALDDFGIGTSSLAYLKTLPVDYLKIDGSFIRNITTDAIDRAMAETINRVGHIMGLQTVGEYAESPEIIEELRLIGVDFAQGYGVQRPQPLPQRSASSAPDEAPAPQLAAAQTGAKQASQGFALV